AARAAHRGVPGRAVADADVDLIEHLVVDDGVPHRATTAERPPFTVPGARRHLHHFALEALGRVAGHGVETPDELAGVRIVGADEAAHAILGTGLADQHHALGHAR